MKVIIESGKQDYRQDKTLATVGVCADVIESEIGKRKPLFSFRIINGKIIIDANQTGS